MEEDSDTKAPLTRLRRRLSVEKADNVSSPSTPTKKKGGRLAVKPLLDNIDENLPVNSPKKVTRRNSVAKNIPEDERPLTPARRTARILSNTSLTSDTPQAVESPRAKRAAARRQSLAGSDTETAATTPVKQTRRTRKDSTSSVEGPAVPATPIIQVNDVIIEEPETNKISPSPDSNSENIAPNGLRKSPRLIAKKPSDSPEKNSNIEETNLNNSKSNTTSNRKSAGKINSPRSSSKSEENNKSMLSETPDIINEDTRNPKKEQTKPLDASSSSAQNVKASKSPIAEIDSKSSNETSLNNSQLNTNVLKDDKKTAKVDEKIDPTPTDLEKFCQGPPQDIYCEVYIEENSNTDSESKNCDDQCVPVLNDKLSENLSKISSNSSLLTTENPLTSAREEGKSTSSSGKDTTCEPMDIDETLPENVSTANVSKENNISINILSETEIDKSKQSEIQSLLLTPDTIDTSQKTKMQTSLSQSKTQELEKSLNETTSDVIKMRQKNKRKSSLSQSVTQDLEKTLNEKTTDAINTSQKTKRKTSLSQSKTQELEKSLNETTSDVINTSQKNKRKSSLSQSMTQNLEKTLNEKTMDAINTSQKTKRKTSLSQSKTQELEKSLNETTSDVINTSQKNKLKSSLSQSMTQDLEKTLNEKTMDTINTSKKTKRKSSLSKSMTQELEKSFKDNTSDAINKSQNTKRKSSSQSITQDLEKTLNENKSTLILSQVKDDSAREISIIKSPKVASEHKDNSAVSKNNKIKNISNVSDIETPLKIKNIKSLGMQTSTPVLNDKDKKAKKISKESTASSNDEDDEGSEEEDSSEESGLIDGEAEDAGEDYESGDSQDESERQYEDENQILEKGETLETDEDDLSDDSDYEKDSFIVSSDEEDNELLDGSGDDLGMSDNELTMSAKSKKKYNDRKLKEQKKASREIYKARHGGKIQSSESDSEDEALAKQKKKPIRQRIDSSLLGSEDECVVKGKKKNRMRIDSTCDVNTSKVESIAVKGVKNESNIMNENEITAICDDSMISKEDPLKANVKIEPKTPQKDFEISTVNISVRLPIDEVEVDENMSVSRINETSDPLQNQDNNDEDSASLCSENQEIMHNYDSILKDLNKETKTKFKDQNMSLDLNKKPKKKANNKIMDQLNVTETKGKNNKKQTSNDDKNKNNDVEVKENDSSDSLDLKLLFSDVDAESSDSGKDELSKDSSENFIPLRRIEGKTDVRDKSGDVKIAENKDDSRIQEDTKQMKTSRLEVDEIDGSEKLNESQKKKKKSLLSSSIVMEGTPAIGNVSIESEKKKSKKLSISSEVDHLTPASASKSPTATPSGSKNISKASETKTDMANISATKSESTKKKKKKKLYESNEDTPVIEYEQTYLAKVSTPGKTDTAAEFDIESERDGMTKKQKKRKRKSSAANDTDGGTEVNEDIMKSQGETSILAAGSVKKKRKLSDRDETQVTIDIPPIGEGLLDISNHSTKKSKKSKSTPAKTVTSEEFIGDSAESISDEVKNEKHKDTPTSDGVAYNASANSTTHKLPNNKRKNREVDEGHLHKKSKIVKETPLVSSQVSRLPSDILQQLDDKPIIRAEKKTKIVATSNFIVEETVKRKNKPSHYLEESVYLPSISPKKEKSKVLLKKPKVLPFVPTASISSSGFTTKFQINVIPRETKFVAQTSNIDNFKNNYLYGKNIKRMGTYDLYKKQRTSKLTKF